MTAVVVAPWLADSRWPTVPIRYVARLGTGHTPSRQHPEYWDNCTIPWVTLADVGQLRDRTMRTIKSTAEKISTLGLANSAAAKHPAGAVILSRTASVGFSAILGTEMATSQDFAVWTCGDKLDAMFLLYALRAMEPDLRRLSMGSTHKTIYMPDIAELSVPLPPKHEQRRITKFLDVETRRIDSIIRLRESAASLAAEKQQTTLDAEVEELRNNYGVRPLRRLITRMEQGHSPQCENIPAKADEWGVLKVSAVKAGRFDSQQNKRLPEDVEPIRRFSIRAGDLLVTRANTPALVGATAVVQVPQPNLLLCDKIFRLSVDTSVDKNFISLIAQTTRIRNLCSEASHGASPSMANLKSEDVKAWPIPSAPLHVQHDLVKRIRAASAATTRLQGLIHSQIQVLQERHHALVAAAVTGQIDAGVLWKKAAL